MQQILLQCISQYMRQGKIPHWEDIQTLFQADHENAFIFYQHIVSWQFIEPLLHPHLQEIILFGPTLFQTISREGKKSVPLDLSKEIYELSLEVMAFQHHQEWNYRRPFCSFDLILQGQNFRLTLLHHSLNPQGTSHAYLRVIKNHPFKIKDFCQNDEQLKLIQEMITSQANILLCGSTGSGKTSLLTSMANTISLEDHLVIIEDLAEINLQHPHQTRMVARGLAKDEELKQFCAYALRASPDRMILGEIRSHEVVPFILAMNTGHRGLMSTLHANGPHEAIERLALLFSLYAQSKELSYNTILKLMSKNIDYVIYIEHKKIKQIAKILGSDQGHVFFEEMGTLHHCVN